MAMLLILITPLCNCQVQTECSSSGPYWRQQPRGYYLYSFDVLFRTRSRFFHTWDLSEKKEIGHGRKILERTKIIQRRQLRISWWQIFLLSLLPLTELYPQTNTMFRTETQKNLIQNLPYRSFCSTFSIYSDSFDTSYIDMSFHNLSTLFLAQFIIVWNLVPAFAEKFWFRKLHYMDR